MNSSSSARAQELFQAARTLPIGQRTAYLDEHCAGDEALRARIEDLLSQHARALETQPAAELEETRASDVTGYTASNPSSLENDRVLDAGTVIAKRYRIVSLLGRGGMGEVYRADDLILGETIALKFLRRMLAGNREWLDRFTREVQIARAVTHPNICRVHDLHIDEQTGETFISMAYIDGEDLRTLLRRIGRLPFQKAIEFSRQLCVGLTAAHAHGILHRDLKPANIMIDGEGQLCITDFGLAAIRGQIAQSEIRAGTPTYMAPELFAGTEVSAKSDIYALGLVIYELFSGQPTFAGDSFEQIAHAHQRLEPPNITTVVPETPPAVERVINACLEKDPNLRPASPITVAAALPGSDTLGLAQSAGVTPSPTLVAAAGQQRALLNARTMVLLSLLPVYLLVFAILAGHVGLPITTPQTEPTPVLVAKARELVKSLTNQPPGEYEAYDLLTRSMPDFVFPLTTNSGANSAEWILPDESIRFWYRTSSVPLVPTNALNITFSRSRTTLRDPPRNLPGMITLVLNERGELRGLERVPPNASTPSPDEPCDWSAFLSAAGLEQIEPSATRPTPSPNVHHDQRYAWQTPTNTKPEASRRVVAASDAGQPVWFLVGAGPRSGVDSSSAQRRSVAITAVMIVLMIAALGAIPLAWMNIARHRSDLRGATELALFVAAVRFVGWLLLSSHAPTLVQEFQLVLFAILRVHFEAGLVWLFYTALEPYVRRFWPETIVAWSRILKGRFGDALVARDILMGTALGSGIAVVALLDRLLPELLGFQTREMLRLTYYLEPLLGARQGVATLLHTSLSAIYLGLLILILLVLARMLAKRTWLAIVLTVVVLSPMYLPRVGHVPISWIPLAIVMVTIVWSATRFGLVVVVVSIFVMRLLFGMPLNFTPGAVGWDLTILVYLIILSLAIYGFVYARRPTTDSDSDSPPLDTALFTPSR